ncbi:MAG: fumarylacetoacetate hydrolase family protein [Alphaproteobacteria bacterium]|nr:fumarylacetoacetate hydrolase family protein [Alphaproteobacteria bacterium]
MTYVVSAPERVTVAVDGTDALFPVRRVYCVGRNYAAHAREMGKDPDREPPFFFTKPADALVPSGTGVPYPPMTRDLHHEIELVVAVGQGGADIEESKALDHVFGYAVGIDLTRRDLQGEAKEMGRPWDAGKAFDASAPCTAIRPASAIGHPERGRIWLAVNGEVRQDGDIADLIWSIPEVIRHLSGLFRLQPGDLIFTGTPAGVAALVPGDAVSGGVDGVGEIEIRIV